MSRQAPQPADAATIGRRIRGLPVILAALAAFIGLGAFSPYPLVVVLDALPCPVLILAASTSLGVALLGWLLRPQCLSADLWFLGAALGLGLMALLTLALGVLGIMNAVVWWILLLVTLCLGVLVHFLLRRRVRAPRDDALVHRAGTQESPDTRDPSDWLWLLAAPFAALALLAAAMPPGVQWIAEGNGYDVLEYHLAVPKEYYLNGRIGYLPHNIYANMPFNAEMLYLPCMILIGDPIEAAMPAQMLNALLAVLAAACCWAAARPFGRSAANVAGVVVATCPMICYLCGVAYVENGLLAMTAAALACTIRACNDSERALRWSFLAGCFAGLACGFKYTAVPMVALPIALSTLRAAAAPGRRPALLAAGICSAGAAPMFSPWLVKNAVFTGNPVFPLARDVFPERAGIWSDELAARWHEGHVPDPRERSAGGRLRALGREVLRPVGIMDDSRGRAPQFGLAVWALPLVLLASYLIRRPGRTTMRDTGSGAPLQQPVDNADNSADRGPGACCLVMFATLATWLGATHLVGRFALPILAPLAVLSGMTWSRNRGRITRCVLAALLVGGAVLSVCETLSVFDQGIALKEPQLAGRTDLLETGQWPEYGYLDRLNELLSSGKRVLIVAEARTYYLRAKPAAYEYCVVFNRNPFAEVALRQSPQEVIEWLRHRGVTHVLVHWTEMRRLRASRYGFWEGVDESLFERLKAKGLYVVEEFRFSREAPRPYATLFVLP